MTQTHIINGRVLTPSGVLDDCALTIQGGQISAIGQNPTISQQDKVIDAAGLLVCPGFIDTHIHGVNGADMMDGTPEALEIIGRFLAQHGVTGYLPTTMTQSAPAILAAINNVAQANLPADVAQPLGVHVEGPYLNPDFCGAQSPDLMRTADPAEYREWFEFGVVKLIALAPELDGAQPLVEAGLEHGIRFSAAHTGATYEQMMLAKSWGITQVTHTFNAMTGLHHRRPGMVGAALADDDFFVELIADGVHVHPAAVKLLIKAKRLDKVVLISDAMSATGKLDGEYELGGARIVVQDGVARTESGALAGSTLTLDVAVRNVMAYVDLPVEQVVPMVTHNPAEALGLAPEKGVLAVGADADIVLLSSDGFVQKTIIAGEIVYKNVPDD